jgi:predicted lipid carrier protein YhbT
VVRWQVTHPRAGTADSFDLVLPGRGRPFVRMAQDSDGTRPRVTVTLSASEMLALGLGRTDPFTSYARRRILFEGDASFMATVASLLSSSR